MKKLIAIAASLASIFAIAAISTETVTAIQAFAPTSITSATTNSVVVANPGIKGVSEVFVNASAASGRTALNVAIYGTNTVSGGWSLVASKSVTTTNSAIVRVSFPGEYMPDLMKVGVGSVGASTTADAVILTHK